jgi:hypothetical protein
MVKTGIATYLLTASFLALGASATPIGPNLLVNGGFESGPAGTYSELGGGSTAITGWETTLSGVEYFTPAVYGVGPAAEGAYAVDLANYVYTGGGIKQTFATTSGTAYELDFAGSTSDNAGRLGTGSIDVLLNGALAGTFNLANHSGVLVWQDFSLGFAATGSATTLEFRNHEDPYLHFANLDNAVVGLAESAPAAVPEPGTLLLLLPGVAFLFFRFRATPARA